ncbi:LysR family transcriptional regulator [Lactobacillus sp. S2-2]|uniref:LysR family transcriptional regulator n=1 Tax=Lactobacillus sp. S2-2 TaxID=2692917 RepID=UPI001F449220|nr:LysR family transcriptional regulator [Lactobacillus sp. S2-2]MCF6515223.1 LysR family transcriptional regulator [Lactobacillus sp. S2-2]
MVPFPFIAFEAVIKHKNFHNAARNLEVTPSAISHSISQLEKELGFSVFIRNRTGVNLTSNGQQIQPFIQEVINANEHLHEEADNIKGLSTGKIRLGAFSSVCINWLPPIIQSFRKEHPSIDISVMQKDFSSIAKEAKIGTVDLGFSCNPLPDGITAVPLLQDEIYCVTPKDFVPENGESITKADIKKHQFILQKKDYDGDVKQVLDHYDTYPSSLQYSVDDLSIVAMVESGLGIGILPKLALERLNGSNVKLYPFDQVHYRTIYLVMNDIQIKVPATRQFFTHIKNFIEEKYPSGYLR